MTSNSTNVKAYACKAHGKREFVEPATWGQIAMDRCIRRARHSPTFFNAGDLIVLERRENFDTIKGALEKWAAIFDILRTRFDGAGRDLRQVVARTATFEVHHVVDRHRPVEDVALAAHEQNMAGVHVPENAAQWRACVAEGHGGAMVLSICFNHMLADGFGWQILRAGFIDVLMGKPVEQPVWTATDQARFEHSPEGRQLNRRALRRMSAIFADAPRYQIERSRGEEVRYHVATLTSDGLPAIAAELARHLQVSDSSILLAAYLRALRPILSSSKILVQLTSGNRTSPRTIRLPANLAWDSPALVEMTEDFGECARTILNRSMQAYRHGLYHPLDADDLLLDVCRDREIEVVSGVHFNDTRGVATRSATAVGKAWNNSRGTVEFGEAQEFVDAAIYLHLRDSRQRAGYVLELVCDTTIVPRETMRSVLEAIEEQTFVEHAKSVRT